MWVKQKYPEIFISFFYSFNYFCILFLSGPFPLEFYRNMILPQGFWVFSCTFALRKYTLVDFRMNSAMTKKKKKNIFENQGLN